MLNQLEVVASLSPPSTQMIGGNTLCMVHLFHFKEGDKYKRLWMTVEATLAKFRSLSFRLQRSISSPVSKRESLSFRRPEFNPKTILIGNHPVSRKSSAEMETLRLVRVHQTVTNLCASVGYSQRSEQEEIMIDLELQPTWGEAVKIWRNQGWARYSLIWFLTTLFLPIFPHNE